MIQGIDHTSAIAETKSYRKEIKLKPSVAEAVTLAAASVGMDMSTFMASAAYKAAQEVQQAQHRTALTDDAFDAFAAAVDGQGRANDALRGLYRQRDAMLTDG